MIKILILLSLVAVGCQHTASTHKCNGDAVEVHVCPAEGHGPCWLCDEEDVL